MKKIALIFVLFIGIQPLMADNGDLPVQKSNNSNKLVISGKVLDITTGESIAGACVTIKGTNIKVYTDLDGNYTISDIVPGTYTIDISMISYKSKEIQNVLFNSGNALEKNVILESAN